MEIYISDNQYSTINAFGFSRRNKNQKKYLLGKLPMADAFIAWGRATDLNESSHLNTANSFLAIKFHLISLLVLVFIWLIYFWNPIRKKLNISNK